MNDKKTLPKPRMTVDVQCCLVCKEAGKLEVQFACPRTARDYILEILGEEGEDKDFSEGQWIVICHACESRIALPYATYQENALEYIFLDVGDMKVPMAENCKAH